LKLITLLTDFGLEDGYPAIMKGVIWGIAPDAQVADISHSVSPQNIFQGALTLKRAFPYFPSGTVHVAVVDPGVGTSRRAIAARLGSQFFVGPDNGLITLILERTRHQNDPIEIVHLNRPEYWLPQVSRGFHGRDVFAPSAAHLVAGVALDRLGTPIDDPLLLSIPAPKTVPTGLQGQVIHVDHFGNLATNIDAAALAAASLTGQFVSQVRIGGHVIPGMVQAFGDRTPGDLIALIDSDGYLAVSVVNGSAAGRTGAQLGDPVEVSIER
jgi:S-adenosylmethionine hydrolase